MSDIIPEEICYDILLHVPAEPLFRFRSVCKTWRRIIDDVGFAKKHLRCQETSQQVYLIIRKRNTCTLHSLPLFAIEHSKTHTNPLNAVRMTNISYLVPLVVPDTRYLPVLSCSGVILLTYNNVRPTLWNPFTRESFVLPPNSHLPRHALSHYCGLGYDSATDDFKVLTLNESLGPQCSIMVHAFIYSLKRNSWKNIPSSFLECNWKLGNIDRGVFVNGALHWINPQGNHQWSQCITAFDLSTEEDRTLPCPSFVSQENFRDFALGELSGCLSLRDRHALWISEDYGENVWTKLVSFEKRLIMGKAIAYIKGKGQVVFQHMVNEFELFDVEKSCTEEVHIGGGFREGFTCEVLTSSLFRLKRSADGDRKNKGKEENDYQR